MKFLLREVLMMRGGRRILITVWSSSRTSGCSSQGLSEMHWEGKERERSGYVPSQTLKRSRPCSAPKWGASQMSPKPKLHSPHLVMLLLLLQAKAKFILAPTQTHTNTATQHKEMSHPMVSFPFSIPLSLYSLLSFRDLPVKTLYSRKQGAGLVQGKWHELSKLLSTGARNFSDLCSPL